MAQRHNGTTAQREARETALPSKWVAIVALALFLGTSGCGTLMFWTKDEPEDEPELQIPAIVELAGPPTISTTTEGSLWDEHASNFLFRDNKAQKVGDLVTILITESSSASNKATTNLDRETTFQAGIDSFWGLETRLTKHNEEIVPSTLMKASSKNEFSGSGSTTRSDKLTSTMTAMVVEVLPNENLVIEGNKIVKVNSDVQKMKLRGVIRPDDIASNNTCLSTSIANAEISYHGRGGVLHDKQHPGWFARIFDWIWPF